MSEQQRLHDRMSELLSRAQPFVTVCIVDSHGSSPADVGSKMIVTHKGLDLGTVGGGRLEEKAIQESLRLLSGKQVTCFCDWSLKADVGMTCGGRVKLYFETWNLSPWKIVIFGAGHVAQALARLLESLPCQVTCIDPRRDWIGKLPPGIHGIVAEDPAALVDDIADDSFVLCMTKGHQSDLPVLQRIFQTARTFPYLGVIGSRAKAAVLRKELADSGIPVEKLIFHCPVGLMAGDSPIGRHHPSEIAVSITAQLIQVRDLLKTKEFA